MPINCSVNIFAAISEAPIAHHDNDLLAKNNHRHSFDVPSYRATLINLLQ